MNMQDSLPRTPANARPLTTGRAGLSVLEFIGCLMALVGGVWLGAIYLGIDVRHAAYVALSDAELLDSVPENWRPVEPVSKNAPNAAELAASVQNEFATLRQEVVGLGTSQPTQSLATAPAEERQPATDALSETRLLAKQASLEYWKRICDVVHSQAKLQIDAETAATAGNATKVAALKGRINRFAANAIRALPTANVDPAARKLGKELATWYENGSDLYDQAARVWQSPAPGQGATQATEQWEQAQLQHHNEGRLLEGRATAVRDSLTRQFGDGFAPLTGL